MASQPAVELTYSVVTPARDEADTLPRLAEALQAQTRPPRQWVIVENGSTDDTLAVARELVARELATKALSLSSEGPPTRGAPIVRAFHAGLRCLDAAPDVVVNVDADVTMEPDYFERLLREFERDPDLGIASGSAWEFENGVWCQRFVTGGTVWGATRAYRWACLEDVLPLDERHGWDGVDQLIARSLGWKTGTFTDLGFRHHRIEGQRDESRWAHWKANGDTAYYLGYRPSYLLARTLYRLAREPAALGLVVGYCSALLRRSPRLDHAGARAIIRSEQRLVHLVRRKREALGESANGRKSTPRGK